MHIVRLRELCDYLVSERLPAGVFRARADLEKESSVVVCAGKESDTDPKFPNSNDSIPARTC